jgi:glutathione gamma-glutamylcysteinyltransferase
MTSSLYRSPLPADTIAFSSDAGRHLFAEALTRGGLNGYFLLAEQFHTQSEPAFCGLGSLVVALNALAIDPGRMWKGPWRWFSEELLDCCISLDEIRRRGLDLDELTCLARCNGAEVELHRADSDEIASWRTALAAAARGEVVVIASYDRASLDQSGAGHYSPIGGYHAPLDMALVLDVARFKYPPHWISAERLWHAMEAIDPVTTRSRGWIVLRRGRLGVGLGFSLSCGNDSWRGLSRGLAAAVTTLPLGANLVGLARSLAPFSSHLVVRETATGVHTDAIAAARAGLRKLAFYPDVVSTVGHERADAVTILILAIPDLLPPGLREQIDAAVREAEFDDELVAELRMLRAQMAALQAVGDHTSACLMKPPAG